MRNEPPATTSIRDYGLIGDTRTAALCSTAGSIDWLCVPRFDGDPVFGRLVGGEDAGSFRVAPTGEVQLTRRHYRPGSAVLETTWRSGTSELTLTEGMVANVAGRLPPRTLVVRRLASRGDPTRVRVYFDPRYGDEHRRPRVRGGTGSLVCACWPVAVDLSASGDLRVEPGRGRGRRGGGSTAGARPGHDGATGDGR